ncbi:tetratricopeptide repeat protein [Runella zeae]|jgi:tetratricopeptide (TPR) repeat protein|uniref:tetratricopeptide repeat protein n=1 Tax=Runella zeae TaxID=94255 RepID=UPI00040E2098|nr:tetratricopeptide repeat protein [Runella zeae]
MNRSILIIIILATVLTGGLYSLPKVVVSSQERKLTQGQDSTGTQSTTSAEEDTQPATAEAHVTPLTAEQQRTATNLTNQLSASADTKNKAKVALQLSDFYLGIRKFDSAAKYAETIALLEPNEGNFLRAGDRYYDAFGFAANNNKSANLGAKTREWYQKALDKNPNLLNAKANLAMTYVSTETPMQGIMLLREVLASDPTNEVGLFNLGLLSMRSNQYEKATERFRQLLKVNADNTKARFYLAVSLAQTGKNKEALEELAVVKEREKDPNIQAAVAELEKELK